MLCFSVARSQRCAYSSSVALAGRGFARHRLQVQHVLVDILRVARAAEILEELFEHRDPAMAVGNDGAGH